MKKILVVEDDAELRELLFEVLSDRYEVLSAPDLASGRSALEAYKIDLILLDVTLPDGSGYEFCTQVKSSDVTDDIPVLILSGNLETSAKVTGFELGADDYIEKPFNRDELVARIKSNLRKVERKKEETIHKIGPFIIDSEKLRVFASAGETRELDLSPMEYRLFSCLIRNEGKVFSRDQLITVCKGENNVITDRTIDTHVHSLRKKIDPALAEIKTHYGMGYSFDFVKAS